MAIPDQGDTGFIFLTAAYILARWTHGFGKMAPTYNDHIGGVTEETPGFEWDSNPQHRSTLPD
jgi:hypothetical protein